VLLCGLPGSGKSTLAAQLERELDAVRLDPDDWLAALGADLRDAAARDRVERLQWALTERLLVTGSTVVVEWGPWSRAERDVLRTRARALGAVVELRALSAPVDELWERVRRRGTPGTTEEELREWAADYEEPGPDELARHDPPAGPG
jgi:predicted kinase